MGIKEKKKTIARPRHSPFSPFPRAPAPCSSSRPALVAPFPLRRLSPLPSVSSSISGADIPFPASSPPSSVPISPFQRFLLPLRRRSPLSSVSSSLSGADLPFPASSPPSPLSIVSSSLSPSPASPPSSSPFSVSTSLSGADHFPSGFPFHLSGSTGSSSLVDGPATHVDVNSVARPATGSSFSLSGLSNCKPLNLVFAFIRLGFLLSGMDGDDKTLYCDNCGSLATFNNGDDGFYYCQICGLQSQDVMDTETDLFSGIYNPFHSRVIKREPMSQPSKLTPSSTMLRTLKENEKPYCFEDQISTPLDFGNKKEPINADLLLTNLRLRYVEGLQLMIQMQCEALVGKFGVNASICGISGAIWLRYVAESGVFGEQWEADVIADSEKALKDQIGKKEAGSFQTSVGAAHKTETCKWSQVLFWSTTLKSRIPVASSLALCFLSCHIVREAILPTDILKWALEGKLPYLTAFLDIENYLGNTSSVCPLTSRHLFRPDRAVSISHLEVLASSVAERTGLDLPPVNFYSIASRYLKQLSLPVEKILPHAKCIYEWSIPPDLWLNTRPDKLPTRVCVMSILIVAIRILYDINGLGQWEMSLSSFHKSMSAVEVNHASEKSVDLCEGDENIGDAKADSCEKTYNTEPGFISSQLPGLELETAELLCNLEKTYNEATNVHEYSKDLASYLEFCKNVVFAGLKMSYEEENIAQQLSGIFQDEEDTQLLHKVEMGDDIRSLKRWRDEGAVESTDDQKVQENADAEGLEDSKVLKRECGVDMVIDPKTVNEAAGEPHGVGRKNLCKGIKTDNERANRKSGKDERSDVVERALERLKSDMEENMFHYLPPQTASRKKHRYIHYRRKQRSGTLNYVAHADYYILLRAGARVTQVDIRTMHIAVLKLEKRLAWLESRIDDSLGFFNFFKFNG
ncbi:hypothetical protein ACLOJK_025175 [Asimina triloba]